MALKCTWGEARHFSKEVVEEIRIHVLVARHGDVLLRHDVIVGMVSLPCLLFPLFRDSGLFLLLGECQSGSRKHAAGTQLVRDAEKVDEE